MQAQYLHIYFISIILFCKIIKIFQELSEYLHFSLTDVRRTDGWTDLLYIHITAQVWFVQSLSTLCRLKTSKRVFLQTKKILDEMHK